VTKELIQVTEYVYSEDEILFAKAQLEKYGTKVILKHEIGGNGHYTPKVAYFREAQ